MQIIPKRVRDGSVVGPRLMTEFRDSNRTSRSVCVCNTPYLLGSMTSMVPRVPHSTLGTYMVTHNDRSKPSTNEVAIDNTGNTREDEADTVAAVTEATVTVGTVNVNETGTAIPQD